MRSLLCEGAKNEESRHYQEGAGKAQRPYEEYVRVAMKVDAITSHPNMKGLWYWMKKENEEKSFIQTKKAFLEKLEVISFISNGANNFEEFVWICKKQVDNDFL